MSQEVRLSTLIKDLGLTISLSDSRRLVAQGAVRINGILETDMGKMVQINEGDVLEVGKTKVTLPARPE